MRIFNREHLNLITHFQVMWFNIRK